MDFTGKLIATQGKYIRVQRVISCINYGTTENPDFYVEGIGNIASLGHMDNETYFYWKQSVDGGWVIGD